MHIKIYFCLGIFPFPFLPNSYFSPSSHTANTASRVSYYVHQLVVNFICLLFHAGAGSSENSCLMQLKMTLMRAARVTKTETLRAVKQWVESSVVENQTQNQTATDTSKELIVYRKNEFIVQGSMKFRVVHLIIFASKQTKNNGVCCLYCSGEKPWTLPGARWSYTCK